MNKNITVFALVMLTLGSIASFSAPAVLADWLIDESGTIMQVDGAVLGDDNKSEVELEDDNISENKETKNADDSRREQLKKQEEVKRENLKKEQENTREAAKKTLERKIELNKKLNKNIENKYELSTKDGELKVKQTTKLQNGQEKEVEIKLKENETLHVDQEGGESIDIDATGRGELEIRKEEFKGRTRLPISVNSDNELIVTRPDGTTKTVTVLPDEAVSKMLEKGVLTTTENVELTTGETGDPVYQVKQEISKKLFGLIPMKFGTETSVSATDPSVVTTSSTEVSTWRKFLQRLAR